MPQIVILEPDLYWAFRLLLAKRCSPITRSPARGEVSFRHHDTVYICRRS